MSWAEWALAILLLGDTLFAIWIYVARHRASARKKAEVEQALVVRGAENASDARHIAKLGKALEEAETVYAAISAELRDQRRETERARLNHDNLIGRIEGILGERETWRRQYLEASSGASSAQSMMLMTIQDLCRQLAAAGRKPRLGVAIQAVFKELSSDDPHEPVGSEGSPEAPGDTGTSSVAGDETRTVAE